jgi:hypothetical protein
VKCIAKKEKRKPVIFSIFNLVDIKPLDKLRSWGLQAFMGKDSRRLLLHKQEVQYSGKNLIFSSNQGRLGVLWKRILRQQGRREGM